MIDEGWRCFVGVPIGEPLYRELRSALGALKAAASAEADELRWIDPQEWHLTLAFMGPTPEAEIPRLVEAISEVAILVFLDQPEAGFAAAAGAGYEVERCRLTRLERNAAADRDDRIQHRTLAA